MTETVEYFTSSPEIEIDQFEESSIEESSFVQYWTNTSSIDDMIEEMPEWVNSPLFGALISIFFFSIISCGKNMIL